MVELHNTAVRGRGNCRMALYPSGSDVLTNEWFSYDKGITSLTQSIESTDIEVPSTDYNDDGQILDSAVIPGSIAYEVTIRRFNAQTLAIALGAAAASKKSIVETPVVDEPVTFKAGAAVKVGDYGSVTGVTAVDASTGLVDHTDDIEVETGPGYFFIKPATGTTLADDTDLLLDFTEAADTGYTIDPNTLPSDFRVALVWMGRNSLDSGRHVTHDIPMMTMRPTSSIDWQSDEPQTATFSGKPIKRSDKAYSTRTHWSDPT